MAGIGAALIGAAVGHVLNQNSMQNQADIQLDSAKQLIDYQNIYNHPSKQMQRLKDAGVNPAFALGSNLQNTSADSSGVSVNPSSGADLVGAAGSFSRAMAENQLIDAQRDNLKSQTAKNLADAELIVEQKTKEQINNSWLPYILSADYNERVMNLDLKKSEEQLNIGKLWECQENANKLHQEYLNATKQFQILGENLRKITAEREIAELEREFAPIEIQKKLQAYDDQHVYSLGLCEQVAATIQKLRSEKESVDLQNEFQSIANKFAEENEQIKQDTLRAGRRTAQYEQVITFNNAAESSAGLNARRNMASTSVILGSLGSLFTGLTHISTSGAAAAMKYLPK